MTITTLNYKMLLPKHLWNHFLNLSSKYQDGFIVYESGQLSYRPFSMNREINTKRKQGHV